MTANHEHTPTTQEMLKKYIYQGGTPEEFYRWHAAEIAAAKVEAYKEAQQIVAGDMTIAEQRDRRGADKKDATYLIQEFDIEIQELQEPDHE